VKAFDIKVEKGYLAYDVAIEVFKKANFIYAEPLFVGSFEKAMNYPCSFITTLPAK
jgi:hypothetical protein